jgi:hypothetical protein
VGAERGGDGSGGARAHQRVEPRQPPHNAETLEHEHDEPDGRRQHCEPLQEAAVDTDMRRGGDAERGRERQTRERAALARGRGSRRETGERSQGKERRSGIVCHCSIVPDARDDRERIAPADVDAIELRRACIW